MPSFQVELHPYLQQKRLVRFAQASGVHVTAYSPLGQGASYWRENEGVMYEETVKEIAKKHGKLLLLLLLLY
jgi:diketogulonate reductase-like aldo/keto reductase